MGIKQGIYDSTLDAIMVSFQKIPDYLEYMNFSSILLERLFNSAYESGFSEEFQLQLSQLFLDEIQRQQLQLLDLRQNTKKDIEYLKFVGENL